MTIAKPKTRFTRAGDVAIAYQIVGDGPVDLVYASGWLHNIDVVWEHPGYATFLNRLAARCRLILFDKRGTGMSDRDVDAPTLEERAEDIRAVMGAAGSDKASIFGVSEGANMTTMFAATHPGKTRSIILIGCRPCVAWKPDWPTGLRRTEFESYLTDLRSNWGGPLDLDMLAPSVAHDPGEIDYFARLLTQSASPSSAVAFTRLWYEMDVRSVLPAIDCPTLVIRREGDRNLPREDALYVATAIPGARYVELPGEDHLPWIGDSATIADEMLNFLDTPVLPAREDRVLMSILMTDIVGSTARAAALGDAQWRIVIEAHDAAAARAIARQDGTLVKSTGDGILATFSGPSRAVAAARAIKSAVAPLDLSLRAAVHTGECLRRGGDVTGIAVTIAARILDSADGGEICVSSTVRDLVAGSGLEFQRIGRRALKGVPGEWDLYRAQP